MAKSVACGRSNRSVECKITSTLVKFEIVLSVASRLNISVEQAELYFHSIIDQSEIAIHPFTESVTRKPVKASADYGKERDNFPQLTDIDRMSYVVAKSYRCAILSMFKSFAHIDLKPALA